MSLETAVTSSTPLLCLHPWASLLVGGRRMAYQQVSVETNQVPKGANQGSEIGPQVGLSEAKCLSLSQPVVPRDAVP